MATYSPELMVVQTIATSTATANATTQPFDNTHTVIAYNTDPTDSVRVGFVTNGTALSASNGTLIPAGSSLTLRIGTYNYRPFGSATSSTRLMRVVAVANTPSLQITFLNSVGDTAP